MILKNKFYCIFLVSVVSLLQTSCESDKTIVNGGTSIVIDDQKTNLVLQDDGTTTFLFNTTDAWTIAVTDTASSPWITLSKVNGAKGKNEIQISAQPNYNLEDRMVYLTLVSGGNDIKLSVLQEAKNGMTDIPILDSVFRAYCLENFDTNKDGKLSVDEANNIRSITIGGELDIKSLKGIEYFSNLKGLDIYNNLSELDLTHNIDLRSLSLEKTQISELDLARNTKLEKLYLNFNERISKIDLTNNPELNGLICKNNPLTELDLSKNTKLFSFRCEAAELTSLDLTKNVQLEKVYVNQNKLTSLDLGSCLVLNDLECDQNMITSLDLSGCIALFQLSCNDNMIASLNISNNPKLNILECHDNKISQIDLSKNQGLGKLDLSNNLLTSLNLVSNPRIGRINTKGNPSLKEIWVTNEISNYVTFEKDESTTVIKK